MTSKYILIGVLFFAACTGSSGSNNSNQPASVGKACKLNSDCPEGNACIITQEVGHCAAFCTTNAQDCNEQTKCTKIGVLEVSACLPMTNSSSETPRVDKLPQIPCENDSDCSAIQKSAVCTKFFSEKMCTIPCEDKQECALPMIGQYDVDFLVCAIDPADVSRFVCLVNMQCYMDSSACYSVAETSAEIPPASSTQHPADPNATKTCVEQHGYCKEPQDCCGKSCHGGRCCRGPGQNFRDPTECCDDISYSTLLGICCIERDLQGCQTDKDCCNFWADKCVDGSCKAGN